MHFSRFSFFICFHSLGPTFLGRVLAKDKSDWGPASLKDKKEERETEKFHFLF
jgi:hypothetical protein